MKLYVAFVLLLIGTVLAQDAVEDVPPDCSLILQLPWVKIYKYSNKADPTTFWQCEESGQPPRLNECPEGTVFIFSRQGCVNVNILSDFLSNRIGWN